ncbi:hypothetical protein [Thermostichus vulcanus]|uniref:Uncharacterized protein n=1 Tax=Thermostichus vulcanus str. 'Rupite' TaxID=2813851 RepID=A0ABT0C7J8_THEVL|nr:hypothetical protein [Thermostichus vulcanus]MCJ2541664.1 hypothetical protein [Thermostichus vulcanus str. 'Rupite']
MADIYRVIADLLLQKVLCPFEERLVQETGEAGIRLRGSVHCLRWFTCVMLEMGFPWQIVQPQELWQEVEQLHHHLGQMLATSRIDSG